MERTRRSSTATGDASRKRKRGALQDISNNTKKLSRRKANDAAKPRRKTTATSVNSALKSSMASTAASKAKKRVKATDAASKTKRRKAEGAENQPPHQKIQTSMLSFQAAPTNKKGKKDEDKENVEVDVKVENQLEEKEEKWEVKKEDNQTESQSESVQKEEVPEEEEPQTQELEQKEEAVVVVAPPVPAVAVAEQRDEYEPRPYSVTFDHKSSCFDEQTYAAKVRDIDAPSATVSSHHAKLVRELDAFYRKHETKYLPEADYIGTVQKDINEKMRTILVDWLVEVGEEYELDSQTFHKAVNLVDRCLKKIKINRKQFQLLGCACMMVAAKFEEVYGPSVEEFVYISDQTYTAEEMLDMEAQVLNALEYRVASTTCYGFIHRYMTAGCTTDKQRSLVKYLCDFSLLFYHMVRFKPSKLVASAVYLARLSTGEAEPWTPTLHHVTKYNPLEIQDCVEELHRLHAIETQVVNTQRDKAKAVSEKYLADKFHAASTIPSCSKTQLTDSFEQYKPS